MGSWKTEGIKKSWPVLRYRKRSSVLEEWEKPPTFSTLWRLDFPAGCISPTELKTVNVTGNMPVLLICWLLSLWRNEFKCLLKGVMRLWIFLYVSVSRAQVDRAAESVRWSVRSCRQCQGMSRPRDIHWCPRNSGYKTQILRSYTTHFHF
jgi:hypothetical protein